MSASPWGSPQSHVPHPFTGLAGRIVPGGGGNRGEGSILGPLGGLIQGNI